MIIYYSHLSPIQCWIVWDYRCLLFVRSFVRSIVRSFACSFASSYFGSLVFSIISEMHACFIRLNSEMQHNTQCCVAKGGRGGLPTKCVVDWQENLRLVYEGVLGGMYFENQVTLHNYCIGFRFRKCDDLSGLGGERRGVATHCTLDDRLAYHRAGEKA